MSLMFQPPAASHGYQNERSEFDDEAPVLDRSIGDFLRQVRALSDGQIEQILLHQRDHGLRFGESAVALKLASSEDVLWALSQQFHYPYAPSKGDRLNAELVVATDPFSDQAEAFRDIRSQLMMGVLGADEPRRALAVLSPSSGEGKTFFAANIAVTFSQLGGRTLLVDGDMRSPRQHELFGVSNQTGLSSILSGRSEANAIHHIQDLPSLYVLPVGTLPPNPLELIQRAAFSLLMKELLSKFDHVVVDTPAAEYGADARVLAAKCGAALVVVRRGKTRMKPLQTLVNAVSKSQATLAGVMINEY